jgi:hypothetical protein
LPLEPKPLFRPGLFGPLLRTIEPTQALAAEARRLEGQVSDLVNEACGLTPDEIGLKWATAPPRMPISPPAPRSPVG